MKRYITLLFPVLLVFSCTGNDGRVVHETFKKVKYDTWKKEAMEVVRNIRFSPSEEFRRDNYLSLIESVDSVSFRSLINRVSHGKKKDSGLYTVSIVCVAIFGYVNKVQIGAGVDGEDGCSWAVINTDNACENIGRDKCQVINELYQHRIFDKESQNMMLIIVRFSYLISEIAEKIGDRRFVDQC